MSSEQAVLPSAASSDARKTRLVLGTLMVSAFVVILNETIMSVALPTLVRELSVTPATAQWLTTGFLLTMAVVIPITGYLLQRIRTRLLFVLAMSFFVAGTALAAAAPGFTVLLVARVVQACGTAIMLPLLMSTAMSLTAPKNRGRTMGNISIVISVAPAIGPTLAGIVLNSLSWRFLFLLVLPIAIAALVLGILRLHDVAEPQPGSLDVASVILSAFGFGGVLYGLSAIGQGPDQAALTPWVPIGVGVAALVLFAWRQLALSRGRTPLLDVRTFGSGMFSLAIVVVTISAISFFGAIIVLPLYYQSALGLTTFQTGLLLLPGGVAMGVASPVAGRIYDRFGPRGVVPVAAGLMSAGMWGMVVAIATHAPVGAVVGAHVVLSLGVASLFTTMFSVALGSVPRELYSHGSAIVSTVQQLAAGAGTALFVTLLSIGAAAATGAEGLAAGALAALIGGGLITLLCIPVALFIRAPRQPAPVGAVGH